jgi:pimeloyl-ACP methyl ester carboxylesterase
MMAEDTIELMNSLEIDQAHILGISIGGMIAHFI